MLQNNESTRQRILFANITMMKYYRGYDPINDPVSGGGEYVTENEDAAEVNNFLDINDCTYGFVRVSSGRNMRIERIDLKAIHSPFIDDVLVIWTAVNKQSNSRVIVGWYNHARVYRQEQELMIGPYQMDYPYNVTAKTDDVVLLPVAERTYSVPSALYAGKYQGIA